MLPIYHRFKLAILRVKHHVMLATVRRVLTIATRLANTHTPTNGQRAGELTDHKSQSDDPIKD